MPDEDVTLDDTMDEVFDDIESRGNEVVDEEPPPKIEIPEEEPEEDAPVEGIVPPEVPIGQKPEEGEEESEVDPALVNPPSGWRPAAKAKWNDIDPDIKAEIKKREQDSLNGVQAMKSKVEQSDKLMEVMKPYEALIRSQGGTPETVVAQMLNSAYILNEGSVANKVHMTVELAQHHGYFNELRGALLGNQLQQAPQGLTPEQVNQMVEQRLQQEREQQTSTSLEAQVAEFESAANEDGTLKYPYFSNVRGLMASIFESSDGNITLEDAYKRAIWADPDIQPLLLKQQGLQDQTTAHADRARRANETNISRRASHEVKQPKPTGSIDDTLEETLRMIEERSA